MPNDNTGSHIWAARFSHKRSGHPTPRSDANPAGGTVSRTCFVYPVASGVAVEVRYVLSVGWQLVLTSQTGQRWVLKARRKNLAIMVERFTGGVLPAEADAMVEAGDMGAATLREEGNDADNE